MTGCDACQVTVLLVVLAVGFAFAIGAHYTGACMGMPHALGAVSAWQALWIMAPLAFAGAALASHGVEHTVGHGLTNGRLTLAALTIVIGVAFALTMLFNQSAVPTSTIQILVFTVIGVALAAGAAVAWRTIAILAVTWAAAPVVAVGLGYLLTRLLDLVPAVRAGSDQSATASTSTTATVSTTATALRAGGVLALALIAVGAAASFTMGANDVANATGPLVGAGLFSPLTAGLIGGAGIAAGVLTWGRPLLSKVASSLYGILRGWLIGPGAGITAGFLLALAAKAAGAVLLAQA